MTDWSTSSTNSAGAPVISMAGPGDYIALLKPRVMSLVVFTALVGIVLAPHGGHPATESLAVGLISLLAIAIGAGASGALNMWWDADIDAVMTRTAKRPIPAGRVTPGEALAFGITLSAGSIFVLGLAANWLAAGLLAFTIFFYAVVYTMWLKRSTPQNIVIGGAAGAFPPMIGWAAVTGSVSLESVVLFLIIFAWTPPHFWALALIKSDDYARARVPMLPVVAGTRATRIQILVYSVVLAPLGMAPWFMGFGGAIYGVTSAIGGAIFLAMAIRICQLGDSPLSRRACGQLFAFSIVYLFGLYAVLLGERIVALLGGAA